MKAAARVACIAFVCAAIIEVGSDAGMPAPLAFAATALLAAVLVVLGASPMR